ncbi:MAG: ATP-binding cassette domain-containing protein [Spirochaetes bacterium]|jgi:fluoroquinolone transport system ATP-binding protein|nr:ATP-binding cassette domain-containing protein [Spirochaetota bacterium]
MIEVTDLYHDYEGKGTYAVENLSFAIPDGQIFGFLGPSGSGKSTVQNLMTKLLRIQQGDIRYDGVSVRDLRPRFFNQVGYSFELPNLYLKLTGFENLSFFAGLFEAETEDPMRILDMVGLRDAAHKRVSNYSKGMKQRLLFARSIINKPTILFLDEPMSGLDPTTAGRIKEIIRQKTAEGVTIFMTTHNMYTADELCHEVAFLHEGAIIAKDTPRNLKLAYGEKSVKVEYRGNGSGSRAVDKDAAGDSSAAVQEIILFPERKEDAKKLHELLTSGRTETVHSQEATLEQIFVQMTGRALV